MHGGKLKLI